MSRGRLIYFKEKLNEKETIKRKAKLEGIKSVNGTQS